ncbi:hypothetical protein Sm713_38410 [Streptomyces sp. TS71-3]|nr:hypothetical protein Sm713_38410 [Streptomyces sp. TS71-3]
MRTRVRHTGATPHGTATHPQPPVTHPTRHAPGPDPRCRQGRGELREQPRRDGQPATHPPRHPRLRKRGTRNADRAPTGARGTAGGTSHAFKAVGETTTNRTAGNAPKKAPLDPAKQGRGELRKTTTANPNRAAPGTPGTGP